MHKKVYNKTSDDMYNLVQAASVSTKNLTCTTSSGVATSQWTLDRTFTYSQQTVYIQSAAYNYQYEFYLIINKNILNDGGTLNIKLKSQEVFSLMNFVVTADSTDSINLKISQDTTQVQCDKAGFSVGSSATTKIDCSSNLFLTGSISYLVDIISYKSCVDASNGALGDIQFLGLNVTGLFTPQLTFTTGYTYPLIYDISLEVSASNTLTSASDNEMNYMIQKFQFETYNCPSNCITCGDLSVNSVNSGSCATCVKNYDLENGKTCACRYTNKKIELISPDVQNPNVSTGYITSSTQVFDHACQIFDDLKTTYANAGGDSTCYDEAIVFFNPEHHKVLIAATSTIEQFQITLSNTNGATLSASCAGLIQTKFYTFPMINFVGFLPTMTVEPLLSQAMGSDYINYISFYALTNGDTCEKVSYGNVNCKICKTHLCYTQDYGSTYIELLDKDFESQTFYDINTGQKVKSIIIELFDNLCSDCNVKIDDGLLFKLCSDADCQVDLVNNTLAYNSNFTALFAYESPVYNWDMQIQAVKVLVGDTEMSNFAYEIVDLGTNNAMKVSLNNNASGTWTYEFRVYYYTTTRLRMLQSIDSSLPQYLSAYTTLFVSETIVNHNEPIISWTQLIIIQAICTSAACIGGWGMFIYLKCNRKFGNGNQKSKKITYNWTKGAFKLTNFSLQDYSIVEEDINDDYTNLGTNDYSFIPDKPEKFLSQKKSRSKYTGYPSEPPLEKELTTFKDISAKQNTLRPKMVESQFEEFDNKQSKNSSYEYGLAKELESQLMSSGTRSKKKVIKKKKKKKIVKKNSDDWLGDLIK